MSRGATPPKILLALCASLGFPSVTGAGSLGGLCCSCTEQIKVVVERGLAGAGGACDVLVLAWQPSLGVIVQRCQDEADEGSRAGTGYRPRLTAPRVV
ncbi:uncharacterized protein P884DRAFT_261776 [Thermothelomyces heterothallicus CBS 202.75]|uniref:uncharacterized protein n=1 Tax=Thermothelomyces heterothallicus CBS 202.75 TaxID=1149848 RepID=UPI0037436BF3